MSPMRPMSFEPKRRYRGLFGPGARRRCPHQTLTGIYGDAIRAHGGLRLWCVDCGRALDGPVTLAELRAGREPR